MTDFKMISHRVGIDPATQCTVQVANKTEIEEKIQSVFTMVKLDQCMICNKIGANKMWSCTYQSSPNSLSSMIVHCENPICFASSRFVIKKELATAKRFFVTQDSLKKLFPSAEILIERADGSVTKANILYENAAAFSKSRLCVGFWTSFTADNGEPFQKVSTLEEIFAHNETIVCACRDIGKIPIEILEETEFACDFPGFYHQIKENLKQLSLKYKIATLTENLRAQWH